MCLTHIEVKQTETLEFGAERERCIAEPSKENGWLVLKSPEHPNSFQGVFIGKIWGEGCRVCDFLLIGWW